MIDQKLKRQIDAMDYETMLRRWRFSPSGDPMFQGEVGEYFKEEMFKKRDALSGAEQVKISKAVGWGI